MLLFMLACAFWLVKPQAACAKTEYNAGYPRIHSEHVEIIRAASRNQWSRAEGMMQKTSDPLVKDLYAWLFFTNRDVKDFEALSEFIHEHPHWPSIKHIRNQAEKVMPESLSARQILGWFEERPPQTATGVDRYMTALINSGQVAQAQSYLSEWWTETLMSRDDQKILYRKYGRYITRDAHRKRFDRLLFSGQYANAQGIAEALGEGYPQLAAARIALAEKKPGVDGLVDRVPKHLQGDPGLLYERVRWRRKHNYDVGAMELLHQAPAADQIQNPSDWWRERHILIRRLLEKRHYRSAYLLASKHQQKSGFSYAQAEWLAGWLALRFANKPTEAYQRFQALHEGVETPISKARAAYWAGRAAQALGDAEGAARWFKEAAHFQTTFYGQTAANAIGANYGLAHAAPPVLDLHDKQRFEQHELIRAARLLHAAGLREQSGDFIQAFIRMNKSPKVYRYTAEILAEMKNYYSAVKVAKDATTQGMFLTAQAYPIIPNQLRNIKTEWALIHALIRQESMFDHEAVSHAGARGLMQLMPATARETARKARVSYRPEYLTAQPSYNILLGTAYLDQLLRRFNGSYPLAIAAYNAGPSRVDKWLEMFGDPRTGQIDLIDWIELIPIYETRNYVQRVLEATYVYRMRLTDYDRNWSTPIHVSMPKY